MIRNIGVKAIGINHAVLIQVNEGTGEIKFVRYIENICVTIPCDHMASARWMRRNYIKKGWC